ncbi:hypothetical protein CLOSTHATH_07252 [Hungatella hathewayi DSM 13479]|uniref:Uncharacterized protein n=1 Tax=Hungatella hathewayi DSM 13479 TaxID=566550 RepID=D3AUD8_9FIRM|nr:hypothetical protein CLOSTHATH_07252 [Hungatella hathewayi DSM 13479]
MSIPFQFYSYEYLFICSSVFYKKGASSSMLPVILCLFGAKQCPFGAVLFSFFVLEAEYFS